MKKFLSMVLALVMAMSLVTFAAPAAGAKDFTDNDSIQYKEAVDVISAIQIMDGYADASFNPSGTLTRGAAAKIICNMILGPTTASALPTNVAPFPDVPAGSTFAGYIAYCSEHGIISGYADGNFRPADSLSGYAYLKMLLGALGYDQEIEGYKGANWRVNVAKQALGIGLDDDLIGELDGSRIVTREEAALYAFNTLQSDMVEYDSKTTVAVNGATVTVGGNKYQTRTWGTQKTQAANISDATKNGIAAAAGGQNIVQFAEEYFPNLERWPLKNAGFAANGSFGEPSVTWRWKNTEVGTYPKKAAKTYVGEVKVNTIYNDLGLGGTSDFAGVYLNGDHMFDVSIRRANSDKLNELKNTDGVSLDGAYNITVGAGFPGGVNGWARYNEKIGDGTITEVFYDDDTNGILICSKSVYPGEVTSVHSRTSTKDAYIVIEQKQDGNAAVADDGDFSKSGHDEFTVDGGFQEDDIVWFTYSNSDNEIGEVHKMESVEGSLTKRVAGKSATIDNTTYNYGKEKAFDMVGGDNAMTTTSNYILYRDANGFALWVEEADFAVERYALVERIWLEDAAGNVLYNYLTGGMPANDGDVTTLGSNETGRVRLLLANGTTRFFDLDELKRYRDNTGFEINDNYDAGMVVRYTENNDGTVRLYAANSGGTVRMVNTLLNKAADEFYIKDRTMHNLFRGYGTINEVEVRADSSTIFIVKDPDATKTYTGVRNAPNVEARGFLVPVAYAYVSSGDKPTAKVVFIEVSDSGDVQTASKDITFLTDPSDPYEIDGDWYVDYSAVIKGVVQSDPVTVYLYDNNGDTSVLYGARDDSSADARVEDGSAPSVIVGNDFMSGSIILNKTNYDNDHILTTASYSSATVKSEVAQGIKRTSKDNEIKVDTHDDEITLTLDANVNVYYVDGDAIAKITVGEIKNDSEDMVYYTIDDGDVTNLFIVDYEDDDVYMSSAHVIQGTGVVMYTWSTKDVNDSLEGEFITSKVDNRGKKLAAALSYYDPMVASAVYDPILQEIVITYYDDGSVETIDVTNINNTLDATDYE